MNLSTTSFFAVLVALLSLPLGRVALAQDSAAQEVREVEFFLGYCVRMLPDHEKIRAASRILAWKSLPKDAMTMLGPMDSTAKSEGWFISDSYGRFILGISEGKLENEPVKTCSIGSPDLSQEKIVAKLNDVINLKYISDDIEAGQRYRAWTTKLSSQNMLIMLMTHQNSTVLGGTISAAVKVK